MNKNILAVDTSSRVLSVAIKSGSSVFKSNLDAVPRHSERLIGIIEKGLKRLKLKKENIHAFVWGLGPGSFTGLRIGLSVLKGFHLCLRKKSFGASSLDLIALSSSLKEGELLVCVDARRQSIYAAKYQFKNGAVKKVMKDTLLSFDELIRKTTKQTIFSGDALTVYGDLIRSKHGKNVLFLKPSFWYPQASQSLFLSESKREWLTPLSLKTMVPRYFRFSEAEERLRAKK
jgi:tRNA threonylcarbamoyladenosine biosynthesis protein TsaB